MTYPLTSSRRRFVVGSLCSCLFVLSLVVVGSSLRQPGLWNPFEVANTCPPGYTQIDPVEYAKEFRPGISESEIAKVRKQFGERTCLLAKHPEPPAEMMRMNEELMQSWGVAPPGALRLAVMQKQAMQQQGLQAQVANADGNWEQFGRGSLITDDPRYGSVNGLGIGFNNGRVDSFDYDPVNQRLFASVGTGGVWMSTDLAGQWEQIGDKLPTLIIGSVAWTPASGGTLIAGSGEPLNGGFTFVGMGAFWTNDLGATWNQATGVPDGAMTYQVEVDPSRPEIVYAATSKGLYRSTDAGRSYVNVVLLTSCSDLNDKSCQLANFVTDVVVKEPGGISGKAVVCGVNGCPVLAAVGYRGGKRPYLDGKPHAPGNGLYRSDTGEPGSFAKLNVFGDGVSPIGFTIEDRVGRTELGNATGPQQDHNYVYAIVQDAVRLNGGVGAVDVPDEGIASPAANNTVFNGLYVSPDFGNTWIRMADETELANPSTGSSLTTVTAAASNFAPGIQAWYNMYIRIDPTRQGLNGVPTRLVFGLEEVWTNRAPNVPLDGVSQQGNEDFKVIGTYFSGTTCQFLGGVPVCPTTDPPTTATTTHPDQQDAIFIQDGQGGVDLFVGNDGGVYRQHAAAGVEFDNSKWGKGANEGFYTLLPYGIGVAKDCTVWFGLQDNGSGRIEPDTRKIFETFGGDGGITAVDPANSEIAYTETPGGVLRRTTDGGRSWTTIQPTQPTRELFINPYAMDPTDAKHLMTGGPQIVENLNAPAATTGNWVQVFNLGTAPAPSSAPRNMTAVDLQADAAYVGFCGLCNVFTTRANTSQTFQNGIATNVGGTLPPRKGSGDGWHFASARGLDNRFITAIEIDPGNAATVYVTLSGYSNAQWLPPGQYLDPNTNIGAGHVFKSVNGGEDFVDVSGNLPNIPVFWVTLRNDQLIVGTQIGAFISSDTDGSLWAPFGVGMPNVPTLQLTTFPGDLTQMYASTFGRGVWRYRFPGEREICPVPPPELRVVAPVQLAPTNVESPAADPACGTDTNGAYNINFSYAKPVNGTDPAGFRVEEATRIEQAYFDNADEMLTNGSNSKWQGTSGWRSQANPTTGSLSYYAPATMDQNDTLTMINPVTLISGGGLLRFDTTQSTEACCDFFSVEISADNGANFSTLASYSGDFIGSRQIDLTDFGGQAIKLRFRITADQLVPGPGAFVENIRIDTNDFQMLADTAANAISYSTTGRSNGTRHYRLRGLFAGPEGNIPGPYSNSKCVTVDIPNTPPVANAGADFAVNEGESALLSGALSSDADADPLTYDWTQTAGPTVTLSGADTATPSFTSPAIAADTPLTFRLTVADEPAGATASDTITVTVRNVNLPPVANAGADFTVDERQSVMLSGANSSEPDGELLSYAWTQISGPPVVLSNANTATPSFTAPEVAADTALVFRLTVTDPNNAPSTDDIAVNVRNTDVTGSTSILGGGLPFLSLLVLGLPAVLRRRRRFMHR